MKLWQPLLIGAIAAVMPGRAVAGDDDRQETTLYSMLGTRIYSVAMKRPDGPAAAINFTIDSSKGVQILATRQLASMNVARSLAAGAAVQICASSGPRVVFHAQLGSAASYYYVADAEKKRWAEFPKTVTKCPSVETEPPRWNPPLAKAL
jgi:hypothetical protein